MTASSLFLLLLLLHVVPHILASFSSTCDVHAFFYLWYYSGDDGAKYAHWNHEVLPHWTKKVNEKFASIVGDRFHPPQEIHSPFYPASGLYSSGDPSTIRRQFREMRAAGVCGAVLSWWGRPEGENTHDTQGVNTDEVIGTVVRVAETMMREEGESIKIGFHLEPYSGRTGASARKDVEYLLSRFGNSEALLRDDRGRPVFYIYDSYHIPAKDWKANLESLREKGCFFGLILNRDGPMLCRDSGFDGGYTYFASTGFSYGSSPQHWSDIAQWMQDRSMLFVPSVGPGYDDSTIRPWNAHNTKTRNGGSYYDRFFEAAIASDPVAISITSWNEWGEGTQIEPAVPKTIGADDVSMKSHALIVDQKSGNRVYRDYTEGCRLSSSLAEDELSCETFYLELIVIVVMSNDIEELDVGLRVRRLRRDGYEKIECRSSAAAKASSTTTTGFLDPDDVRNLHIELTDKCNAACPQCGRNENGGRVNPHLKLTELSLSDIQRMLPPTFMKKVDRVNLCGNFGDPANASQAVEIVRYLQTAGKDSSHPDKKRRYCKIKFHSNGGARLKKFWTRLGKLLTAARRGSCIFALDGLEDTLHLYRQNVKYKVVERNARSFVAAGGRAVWKFIVFAHNEHQVDEARRRSEALGFDRFQVVKTKRFFKKRTGARKPFVPVRDASNKVVRHLKPPTRAEYQNKGVVEEARKVIRRYGSMDTYYDKTCVRCKAVDGREIYISAEGLVFPCCWIGTHLRGQMKSEDRQFIAMIERQRGGLSVIDAKRRRIENILRGDLFTRVLPLSWTRSSVADGKLRTCARICGTELHTFEHEKRENRIPSQTTLRFPTTAIALCVSLACVCISIFIWRT
eukprot:g2144.t1